MSCKGKADLEHSRRTIGERRTDRYSADAAFRGAAHGVATRVRRIATRSAPAGALPIATRDVQGGVKLDHWGVPYEREPSLEDRAKARFAVDCSADAAVGHHPHIVPPTEINPGCPIFNNVGNFSSGSRNSRTEGLFVGVRFEDTRTVGNLYPLDVKNRDPRVNYQPKVLAGRGVERVLSDLAKISGDNAGIMKLQNGCGHIEFPRPGESSEARKGIHE